MYEITADKKGYTIFSQYISKNPSKLIENSDKYFSTKLIEVRFLFLENLN